MLHSLPPILHKPNQTPIPDKEFRYLRMVIVTTAVYWGLNSQLRSKELTNPLNLPAPGRSQSVYIVLRLRTDLCF